MKMPLYAVKYAICGFLKNMRSCNHYAITCWHITGIPKCIFKALILVVSG